RPVLQPGGHRRSRLILRLHLRCPAVVRSLPRTPLLAAQSRPPAPTLEEARRVVADSEAPPEALLRAVSCWGLMDLELVHRALGHPAADASVLELLARFASVSPPPFTRRLPVIWAVWG